jgi:hypothetical protein
MLTKDYLSSLTFGAEENGESHDPTGYAPTFSAEREVESRMERLHQAWGRADTVARMLSAKYQRLWEGAIISLADYKGTIYVEWRDEISRVMFEGVILGAWESSGEHAHHHEIA